MAWKLVAFRLREETFEGVEGLLPSLSTRGREATRSDSLRCLIFVGLAHLERRLARLKRREQREKARSERERPRRKPAASMGGKSVR